jgi:transposase-like protein
VCVGITSCHKLFSKAVQEFAKRIRDVTHQREKVDSIRIDRIAFHTAGSI